MRFVVLILTLLILSCAQRPPEITPCNIYTFDRADCQSTDPRKPAKDVPLSDLLGYTCISPGDRGAVKTYIYELIKRTEDSANR